MCVGVRSVPITSILPLCYSHSLSGWSRPLVGIPVLPSLLLAERLTATTWVIPGAQRILPDTAGSLRKPHRLVGLADTLRVGRYSCRSRFLPPVCRGTQLYDFFPRASDASPGAPLQWCTKDAVFAVFTRAVSRSLLIVLTLLSICGIR